METAYVICGKLGDVLSGVAIAQSQATHSNVIVSAQYAELLGELPGITLHTYPGSWDDLRGAIKWAKSKFRRVLVPQTFGKDFPIKHTRPSFQLDQAARCGADFDKVRLKVVSVKVDKKPNTILFVDHSESSPFPHTDDLLSQLKGKFPNYNILRSSEIKLPKFTDFVGIYDSVDAIITIDTAHLHLTSATNAPVFALVWDFPHRWRGSAWHSRFKFYCRYGDYQVRKEQLLNALQMALEGRKEPELTIIPMAHENAYNPSIVRFQGNVIRAYRYHPDQKLWPTAIAIDGMPVEVPLKNHSIDDPRLFVFQDKLHVSYVVTPYPVPTTPPAPCAIGYGEVEIKDGKCRILGHIQPKYGKNDFTGQEKNFVFFEHNKSLHFIYKCSPEQEVVRLEQGHVQQVHKSLSPKCSFGDIRGGTQPIPYKGQWLRFFHTLVKSPEKEVWWQYYVSALLMDSEPPFRITAVSKIPILTGDERYFHDWKFYKPRVQIVYGAIESDGGWRLSVGVNDSRCADVIVKPEHLNL